MGRVRAYQLSCSTGVLPAAGRHGSPGPGARETPGCGHPAGRGEAGPQGLGGEGSPEQKPVGFTHSDFGQGLVLLPSCPLDLR